MRAAHVQSATELSIVIPTRNRRDRLLATLDELAAQQRGGAVVEVIVVDNGSTDGTADALDARADVTLLREPRPGASFARNRALDVARGEVVLLLGDDMVPASGDLLLAHLALHARNPDPGYAVLGQVRWAPPVSSFMRWLETSGFQFSFDHIAAGAVDPAAFLYSSHASLKRELLDRTGGFDGERFPYLMEDIELGIRLRRSGVTLDYRPELLVHHHHAQTLDGFARRMTVLGASARRLRELYPDEAPAQVTAPGWKGRLYGPASAAGRALLAAGARGRLRERAWTSIVMAAYVRGWRGET